MANDLIKYGLLAGGAYLIYREFFATPAATVVNPNPGGAPASGTPPPPAPPAPPPYVYTPPTTVQALQNAAGAGVTMLNADQWKFYWDQLKKPDLGDNFATIFFPNGRPASDSQNPRMTAAEFVAAVATKGFSGLGQGLGTVPLWLPVFVTPGGVRRARR